MKYLKYTIEFIKILISEFPRLFTLIGLILGILIYLYISYLTRPMTPSSEPSLKNPPQIETGQQ